LLIQDSGLKRCKFESDSLRPLQLILNAECLYLTISRRHSVVHREPSNGKKLKFMNLFETGNLVDK